MWPFRRPLRPPERRSADRADYTSRLLDAAQADAQGDDAPRAGDSGAAIAAAGMLGRGLSAAEVRPAGPVADALADILFSVGDWLVRFGQAVFVPTFTDRLEFLPASHLSVARGGADPRTWEYLATLTGPGSSTTMRLPAAEVLHFRIHTDPARPWQGRAPVDQTAGRALVATEDQLRAESRAAYGTILPVPPADDAGKLDALTALIRRMRGAVLPIEAPAEGRPSVGESQLFRPQRFGFAPPQPAVDARDGFSTATSVAAGVPLELTVATAASASREGFRRWERTVLRPTARLIEREVARKTGVAVELDFSELAAADVMSRSRAVASLVTAGVEVGEAMRMCGFDRP